MAEISQPPPAEPQQKPGLFERLRSRKSIEDKIKLRRSKVRVVVTYGAAAFLFGGGALFIGYLALYPAEKEAVTLTLAKEIFFVLVPVATSIVTFWFAGRRSEDTGAQTGQDGGGQG